MRLANALSCQSLSGGELEAIGSGMVSAGCIVDTRGRPNLTSFRTPRPTANTENCHAASERGAIGVYPSPAMTSAPAARASTLLVLFAVAAAYFALGCTLTLEWADEGHLIYQSWRVSNGALPYRDALHLYAPSVFLVNGLLLHLFGPQLLVIRASLVLLKAVLAALVYQSARQLASWPFALAVYALFVAMWGAPMWLFNAPYASHYAVVVVLVGVLAFLQLRQRAPLRACALAGVCFGVATTFKQTSGFFAFAAFVLYLLLVGLPGTAARLGSGSLVA